MKLSQAQLGEYEKNGYLVVENLVSPENLATLSRRIDEAQQAALEARAAAQSGGKVSFQIETVATPGATTKPVLRKLIDLAIADEFFRSIAATPAILDIVLQLTGGGTSVLLYSDQAFLKPAFCGSPQTVAPGQFLFPRHAEYRGNHLLDGH